MIIDTKFEIGDTIWFMAPQNKLRVLKVQQIHVALKEAGKKPVIIITPTNSIGISVERCFATKKELIAHYMEEYEKSTGKEC